MLNRKVLRCPAKKDFWQKLNNCLRHSLTRKALHQQAFEFDCKMYINIGLPGLLQILCLTIKGVRKGPDTKFYPHEKGEKIPKRVSISDSTRRKIFYVYERDQSFCSTG